MNEIKKFFIVLVVFIVFVIEIPFVNANTVINYSYPTNTSGTSPCIVYNNSTNFPPLWNTNLNPYRDQAYSNITDIWASSIYTQENNTSVFANSYGDLIISWNGGVSRTTVYSPYIVGYKNLAGLTSYAYLGPIVGVAAMNTTNSSGSPVAYVQELTQNGAVFELNELNKPFSWVQVAQLPGTNWTSITTNLNAMNYSYQESFYYTNYNGTVYTMNKYNNSKPFVWNSYQNLSRNIYADVNFLSGTSMPYGRQALPGSEEVTVWPSSVLVNYIALGLRVKGSSSIHVSIGTGLWKSDILSNITFPVTGSSTGRGTYAIYHYILPTPIVLHRNVPYYLNVYKVSGTVEWLYTESPYITNESYNYLQDYWYSRNTLYHDNSYPYLFAIGYQGSPNIISTVAYYNGYLYGLSWNGTVWSLYEGGWMSFSYINNTGGGFKGITLQQSSTQGSSYLYVMNMFNNTSLNVSSPIAYDHNTFNATRSKISNYGTNEAITYDAYTTQFKFIQTNGTVGYSNATTQGTRTISWTYVNQLLNFNFIYPTILQINSTFPNVLQVYALLNRAINYTSLYIFQLYFNGSDGYLKLQLYYQYGQGLSDPHYPVNLTSIKNVLINVTMRANMAFNTKFYMYTVIYYNGIYLNYVMNIRIINHFSFIPLG